MNTPNDNIFSPCGFRHICGQRNEGRKRVEVIAAAFMGDLVLPPSYYSQGLMSHDDDVAMNVETDKSDGNSDGYADDDPEADDGFHSPEPNLSDDEDLTAGSPLAPDTRGTVRPPDVDYIPTDSEPDELDQVLTLSTPSDGGTRELVTFIPETTSIRLSTLRSGRDRKTETGDRESDNNNNNEGKGVGKRSTQICLGSVRFRKDVGRGNLTEVNRRV